ncbi:hypothetical protein ST201phi2-1p195 [Pseudomonas phage 201phi2-1]|uniref:Uncharacterized protein n=1 Tax=Pseudomonas phage 201phi2-1 TaxID=198110 RepID=B3FJ58_BP201|nr:hypothetical protein ST201phi2-1p195 [Pseudomonas phage 201phi2-1]ABY63025.1 hypothetical protein 201phi2-1p195 [Pseudomonas phage 201phi2-1]
MRKHIEKLATKVFEAVTEHNSAKYGLLILVMVNAGNREDLFKLLLGYMYPNAGNGQSYEKQFNELTKTSKRWQFIRIDVDNHVVQDAIDRFTALSSVTQYNRIFIDHDFPKPLKRK